MGVTFIQAVSRLNYTLSSNVLSKLFPSSKRFMQSKAIQDITPKDKLLPVVVVLLKVVVKVGTLLIPKG